MARAIASLGRASISCVRRPARARCAPGTSRPQGPRPRCRSIATPSSASVRREQVVGERPLGRDALELQRDRVRLPGADPDGQVAVAPGLLEDHHVLGRQRVHAHALHHHLDHAGSHGGFYRAASHLRRLPPRPARASGVRLPGLGVLSGGGVSAAPGARRRDHARRSGRPRAALVQAAAARARQRGRRDPSWFLCRARGTCRAGPPWAARLPVVSHCST